MPFIDDERGVVVLRIVYDGPPFSGKTTSLKTLARRLGVAVITPAEENGRTLFFDWADYVGGLFEGRRIRCQIISVPGQADFERRRRALLESADAVIFVADTRASALEASLTALGTVIERCRAGRPPIGVVMQANKRDDPASAPLGAVRARLNAIAPIAINETVATDGDGVRETFVFAVRLALDRVRAVAESGGVQRGRPDVDAPEDLLASLEQLEDRVVATPAAPLQVEVEEPVTPSPAPRPRATLKPSTFNDELAFVPNPAMPSGLIWPPVDGRMLLHEVSRLNLKPRRGKGGEWAARGEGWRFHSFAECVYESGQAARSALITWARAHASRLTHLSPGRILVLADVGEERFRLWQLLRVVPTLRESLQAVLLEGTPEDAARELVVVATKLALARELLIDAKAELPCSLWTIGTDRTGRLMYVGLMPEPGSESTPLPETEQLIEREITPLMQQLRREHGGFVALARELRDRARSAPSDAPLRIVADIGRRTTEQWYGG